MNKARLWKSTIGMTSALTIMMSTNGIQASATQTDMVGNQNVVVSSDVDAAANSLAGISLSLDNYYADTTNTTEEAAAAVATAAATTPEAQPEVKKETKKVSKYEKTGIATVDKYVNIRKKSTTNSDVVGKLHKGGAATILATEGEWVKVKSGSVTGYIKKEFLAIGEDAEKVADKLGKVYAVVKTETLRVREKKSTDSKILTLLGTDEKYDVCSQDSKWVKVKVGDVKGYVSKEFVDVKTKFGKAISLKEEQEAAAKKAAQEAAAQEEARQQSSSVSSSSSSTVKKTTTTSSKKTNSTSNKTNYSSSSTSSKSGSAVASYATQFVGNPYRWGGTSLTNGADCSGFTMSVYKHFGISLARTSSAQSGSAGYRVSTSNLQAGDLVFYGSGGSVSHVAIYIGGGKIVHASTRSEGIKISNVFYKTPICARRVL